MIYFYCVYEDEPTWAVMQKMLSQYPERFCIQNNIPCNGYGKIRKKIGIYNNAARNNYFFIITDLDTGECAPSLIREWLPHEQSQKMFFRVAVKEVESWLLADRDNIARFIGVRKELMSFRPDEISDPKNELISLVRIKGKKSLRSDIVPIDRNAKQGPGYNMQLREFIKKHWDISNARKYSPSLERAVKALQKLAEEFADKGDKHVRTGSI
jgi:hypothetical protein